MALPEYCATHSLKEFLEMMAEPVKECNCTDPIHGGKLWKCVPNPNLCPIQNRCKYGFVLPDRCRYNNRLGCDCGAYPPITRG